MKNGHLDEVQEDMTGYEWEYYYEEDEEEEGAYTDIYLAILLFLKKQFICTNYTRINYRVAHITLQI